MWNEFRKFIARGNVVDLAVGVIIGAAFGRIVTSLVDGVLMPPLGLLLNRVDFASLFVTLDGSKGVPASLAEAKAKGIPVVAYGQLVNDIIGFLIVAAVVFLIVRQVNRLKETVEAKPEAAPAAPTTKECPFCLTTINLKATRCPACTSAL
jgi:large conductance mechanosensitive channel